MNRGFFPSVSVVFVVVFSCMLAGCSKRSSPDKEKAPPMSEGRLLIRLDSTRALVDRVPYRFVQDPAHAILETMAFDAPGLGRVAVNVEKVPGKGSGRIEVSGKKCEITEAHYGSGTDEFVSYRGFQGSCKMAGGETRSYVVGLVK
ncbi:MAG: hypothetical protein RBU30_00050 [Polyangia bacterium]|jgi:hypothetical protein|nr:hypothetical protein [Polyangia bacterium]